MKRLYSPFLLALSLLLAGCLMQKRIYNKGYYVQWNQKTLSETRLKEKHSGQSSSLAQELPRKFIFISEKHIPIPETKMHGTQEQKISAERRFSINKTAADTTIKKASPDPTTQKHASKSYSFGLTSLLCTLLFPLLIISYPLAAIFSAIAIRNGRKALVTIDLNNEPDVALAKKARQGIRMALVSIILLNTALFLAGLAVVAALYLLLAVFASYTIYVWLFVFITVVAIALAVLLGLWYFFALSRILKEFP